MKSRKIHDVDLNQLNELSKRLVESLPNQPVCIHFKGNMGAGKTTFIQKMLKHYGIKEAITSPTFSIVNEYSSEKGDVLHMDLYRVDSYADIESLGVFDMWSSYALIVIEWPEKDPGLFPEPDLVIRIQSLSENLRSIELNAKSLVLQKCITAIH